MNIDALQALPEVTDASTGLRPKQCGPAYTKVYCLRPTCVVTEIYSTIIYAQ